MSDSDSNAVGDSNETPPAPGLGDLAARFFASVGVSEARYKAAKVAWHLDPKCKCADRRRWLNDMGRQLGVDGVVVKLAKWMDGK
jgi:hypothetical protein